MGAARKHGILPDTHLKTLIREHAIDAAPAITESQIQPASVDLRLGTKAYRLISSFLPERSEIGERLNVLDLYQSELVMYDMDLTQGAILEKGHVYLVPLLEHVALPSHVRGRANPKSSTGRLDIFTRLITDLNAGFDEIPHGYQGPALPGGRPPVVSHSRKDRVGVKPTPAPDRPAHGLRFETAGLAPVSQTPVPQ